MKSELMLVIDQIGREKGIEKEKILAALEAALLTAAKKRLGLAQQMLQHFQPALILNRMSTKSRINTLHLQQLLKQYVGTDLSVLGNIPEDLRVQQSILKYLPVVEFSPQAPAALAFDQITENVLELVRQQEKLPKHLEEPRKIRA